MALDIGHREFEREVRRARGRRPADPDRWPSSGAACPGWPPPSNSSVPGSGPSPILEQSDGVGGTWRDNVYPGAACDVPSHLYSFSFAPEDRLVTPLRRTARDPRLRRGPGGPLRLAPHLRTGHHGDRGHVRRGHRRPGASTSRAVPDPTTLEADTVVFACGQLNRPHVPDVEGVGHLRRALLALGPMGPLASTSAGQRVAVVGSGASAIQFVPPVAEAAARTTVFQRSPNYVGPKKDRPYAAGHPPGCSSGSARSGPPTAGGSTGPSRCAGSAFRRDSWAGRPAPGAVRQGHPGRGRQRTAARARRGPRLPDRVQADPHLQRLVPDAAPTRRRRWSTPPSPDRARRRGDRGRHPPPGRRPHLRDGVRHHLLPVPHPGVRCRRPAPGRGLDRRRPRLPRHRRGRLPQLLRALRAQYQPRPQLHPLHGRTAAQPGPPGPGRPDPDA